MFHVVAPGTHTHVFTRFDPAEDGCTQAADRDFTLSHDQDDLAARGQEYPLRCLGRAEGDPRSCRAFRSPNACRGAGYTFLNYDWHVCERWSDYLKR